MCGIFALLNNKTIGYNKINEYFMLEKRAEYSTLSHISEIFFMDFIDWQSTV